jgi:tetratricopeptide (TPR) repeat protein
MVNKRLLALQAEVEDAALGTDEAVLKRCRLSKELMLASDFDGAEAALGRFWAGAGERPPIEGLGRTAAAELLLRAGVLTGWLGSVKQLGQTQAQAKNLVSEALRIFEESGETRKAVEAQTELAFCYWREGGLDEAQVLSREALRRLGDEDRELRAWVLVRSALVECTAFRLNDALRMLDEAAPLLAGSENRPLLGRFHQTLGNTLQFLGVSERRDDYVDRALLAYTAASFHFEQAGDTPNRARTENNVGFLLQRLGRFHEAHEHFDRAASLFKSLRDRASVAQVDDSRAQCLLAEGRLAEAEAVARRAAATLGRGDEQSWLADALVTHGVALARLGRAEDARRALTRAVEVAEQAGDIECAGRARLGMLEELGARLDAETLRAVYLEADAALARTQYSDLILRLRGAARRIFEAQGPESEAGAPRGPAGEQSPASAAKIITEALARHPRSRVEFTPEAVATLERMLCADDPADGVRRLVERAFAEGAGEEVITSDAVEVVALRAATGDVAGLDFARPWEDFSLKNETRRFERPFVQLALRAAAGKISRAANLLGLAQAAQLTSLIKTKHPDLLTARTPPVKRRRGLIGRNKPRRKSPS